MYNQFFHYKLGSILMMNKISMIRTVSIICIFISCLFSTTQNSFASLGSIANYQGTIKIIRQGTSIPVKSSFFLNDKDIIETSQNSNISLIFRDNTEIQIYQNSKIAIYKKRNTTRIQIFSGIIWIKTSQKKHQLQINNQKLVLNQTVAFISVDKKGVLKQIHVADGSTILRQKKNKNLVIKEGQYWKKGYILAKKQKAIVELLTNPTQFYLPSSGKFPVEVRALITNYSSIKQKLIADFKSDALNLKFSKKQIRFRKFGKTFSFQVIGSGKIKFYIVFRPQLGRPLLQGKLELNVLKARHSRNIILKTRKGNIWLKVIPQ
jgi:hypothetical protein